MIRLSAALVVVGLGLLLTGAISSELPIVYAAIAVSAVAAVVLAAGVIRSRDKIFGAETPAASDRGRRLADLSTAGTGAASAGVQAAESAAGVTGGGVGVAAGGAGSSGAAAGTSSSGLGWPAGASPADELWARVDAELSAAGAAARAPRLTRESSTDEVWGRVEQELTLPTQWNPRLSGWQGEADTASRPTWVAPPAERADDEPGGRSGREEGDREESSREEAWVEAAAGDSGESGSGAGDSGSAEATWGGTSAGEADETPAGESAELARDSVSGQDAGDAGVGARCRRCGVGPG
ncbi:MAG TPA: hypothetical protein VGL63_09010 [Streptosporangiaceae bacterium]